MDAPGRAMHGEPSPLDPCWPRYCDLPFPPYRFVPGLNPHPRVDPGGHGFGRPAVADWRAEEWRTLLPWLYGVDLYNYAFWWESHEVLEGLWHAAGRTSTPASFVHGIIHASVANLNRHRGKEAGARRQARKAIDRLEPLSASGRVYMGLEIEGFLRDLRDSFLSGRRGAPPLIRLEW